ncbi:MAG TPA: zinc ribbon domain-containing protein [Euzebya sp.]|nr:zinc ribbon domain-containing protein [Euzebya sp.]
MRCPHCQAANPDTATFCGQCYERFEAPEVVASPDRATGVGDAPVDMRDRLSGGEATRPTATPMPDAASGPAGTQEGVDHTGQPVAVGRFVAGDGGLTWRCAVCETTHEVGIFVCTVCGAKMDAESPAGSGLPVDIGQARRLEAIVPGLGHLRSDQIGMGAARLGIVAIWLLGSLGLASGGPSGLLTALPLVLGMVAIWATGPGDLAAADGGRAPRLDARRFMYLVIAVTTGVIIAGGLVVII